MICVKLSLVLGVRQASVLTFTNLCLQFALQIMCSVTPPWSSMLHNGNWIFLCSQLQTQQLGRIVLVSMDSSWFLDFLVSILTVSLLCFEGAWNKHAFGTTLIINHFYTCAWQYNTTIISLHVVSYTTSIAVSPSPDFHFYTVIAYLSITTCVP